MLLLLGHELSAFGRRQAEEEVTPVNPEWILFITAFDVSAMSPAWQTAGDTITRHLVASLQNIDYRLRGEDEYIFYRDLAWARARTTAASALATRRNERDQLIFRGEPTWRHERAIRTAEEQITTLEEALVELEATAPVVEQRPDFKLHSRNLTGAFPPPPEPGRENHFLIEHRADAFLEGTLSEFHGRILLQMRMFTRFAASFTFEDWVLFSPEDFDIVLEEISRNLTAEVSGNVRSTIRVHATPPEAMVLINDVFIGLGEVVHTRFPGEMEITIQAENFIPVTFPLELGPEELVEIYINLTPLSLYAFGVDTSNRPGSRVYQSGLFVGETPLTLELPRHEFSYIAVETEDGDMGAVIFRDNRIISGGAQFVRMDETYGRADFVTTPPLHEEDRQVASVRNSFYRAYGFLWFAVPIGLLATGFARNHTSSIEPGRVSRANVMRTGSNILIGAAVGTTVFQLFRYIRASRMEAMPMAMRIPPEPEPEEEPEEEAESEQYLVSEYELESELEDETELELEGEE